MKTRRGSVASVLPRKTAISYEYCLRARRIAWFQRCILRPLTRISHQADLLTKIILLDSINYIGYLAESTNIKLVNPPCCRQRRLEAVLHVRGRELHLPNIGSCIAFLNQCRKSRLGNYTSNGCKLGNFGWAMGIESKARRRVNARLYCEPEQRG